MSKVKEKILKEVFDNGIKDKTVTQIAYIIKEDRRTVDYAINKLIHDTVTTIEITFRVARLGIKKIPTKLFTLNLK